MSDQHTPTTIQHGLTEVATDTIYVVQQATSGHDLTANQKTVIILLAMLCITLVLIEIIQSIAKPTKSRGDGI